MRPKKRLGQHFLINIHAAKRIASLLNPQPGDRVLEIGGGRGDLTVHLVSTGADITCIEFDPDMVAVLQERFADAANLHVIKSDILELKVDDHFPVGEIKLVGNLPYNITSPILEWLVDNRDRFPQAAIMIQREVAERLAASHGNKDFGSLTIFIQLFYQVEKIFDVKPGSFLPPPKVSSSVLILTRRTKSLVEDGEFPSLRRLTSACFRWRRKQLIRILRDEYPIKQSSLESCLTELQIDPTIRPEQLPVESFVTLARRLSSLLQQSEHLLS
ncbi:MAG: ribosomal RNA small subunit methyltransferase A [bacterium]|nr:ribosomal RNA small subunit methyltransferase A [bacterium]